MNYLTSLLDILDQGLFYISSHNAVLTVLSLPAIPYIQIVSIRSIVAIAQFQNQDGWRLSYSSGMIDSYRPSLTSSLSRFAIAQIPNQDGWRIKYSSSMIASTPLQLPSLSHGSPSPPSLPPCFSFQLVSMRSALAIAQILNRTLVFPPVWARFDRIWWPHKGTVEGTDTPQPLVVPLDHFLRVMRPS